VAESLDFDKDYDASVFETTIRLHYKVYLDYSILSPQLNFFVDDIWLQSSLLFRRQAHYFICIVNKATYILSNIFLLIFRVVGGLLSAYDLSGDKIFLDKAKDITDRLLPAWDTTSGIPYNRINLAHGRAHNPGWTNVSHWCSIFL
jgi:hypothetical protein